MTVIFFSQKQKLADLVRANYSLIGVLSRFGIKLGFGEKSLEVVCNEYGVDIDLFLVVCAVYTNSNYVPAKEELGKVSPEGLIAYLRDSHNDYRNNHFKRINEEILEYLEGRDEKNSTLLTKFFDNYCAEVENHFQYEEEVLFPYILRLLSKEISLSDFNVAQFEKNHSNIEEKLSDLKNILIKYVPYSSGRGESADVAQSRLLADLFRLEEDLAKHTLIEDKLLVPIVYQLEKQIN